MRPTVPPINALKMAALFGGGEGNWVLYVHCALCVNCALPLGLKTENRLMTIALVDRVMTLSCIVDFSQPALQKTGVLEIHVMPC